MEFHIIQLWLAVGVGMRSTRELAYVRLNLCMSPGADLPSGDTSACTHTYTPKKRDVKCTQLKECLRNGTKRAHEMSIARCP